MDVFDTQPPPPAHQALDFSADQEAAWQAVTVALAGQGIDLAEESAAPPPKGKRKTEVVAVTGKAGSGKTVLLARLTDVLKRAGLSVVTPDWESTNYRRKRSVAVLAPTNKAASVLRAKGVAATTIHRILYTPVYDPEFQKIAEWLEAKDTPPPKTDALAEAA
ncbi:MAG: AAA family ATPase, partial [Pseudomonadota bacterium]